MPGLSFAFQKAPNNISAFDTFLKGTEYLDGFTTQILLKNKQAALGITKSFSKYPLSSFENSRYQIWMEGKIYNLTAQQTSDEVLSLCEAIFSNNLSPLTDWLNKTDGDFIIAAHDKISGNWAVYRDLLGRLPMYYFRNGTQLILSRDLRFVRKYANPPELDRMGLAQFMLFGYLLGDRTFYKNIQKVNPATLFLINSDSGNITIKCLREFNYSHKQYRRRSAPENAARLARIFVGSCKNRADSSPRSVLKLSGGYDSRTIAAGLKAEGADFTADSWVRKDRKNELDYTTARQVAEMLNVPWQSHTINDCSADDIRITFLLKSGLDYMGFAYPMRNARYLQQTYGSNITVFDGLCGDKFMPDLRPAVPLYTFKALLNYVIWKNAIWSPKDIEALMGISQQELTGCIKEALLSYPEKSLKQKYVHWYIHERGISKFFEGNDRGRSFFWLGTPFLNPTFYDYAMNCPDSQKTNRYLYTLMLKELVPDILNIPYAHNNATVPEPIAHYANQAFQHKVKLQQLIYAINKSPNPLRYLYKKIKKTKTPLQQQKKKNKLYTRSLVECLQQQAEIPEIAQYFSKTQLDKAIYAPQEWGEDSLGHLFTVLTVIEEFHGNTLTIDTFQKTDWYAD